MSEQKISSDIFDITNFVNSLKSKYIPVDNEETLYTSTFGYIGELASNLLQNTIIATSEYSNEAISTRAKFDRNVIIHAMSLGIDKVNAVPATMKKSPANSRMLFLIPKTKLAASMSTPSTINVIPMDKSAGKSCLILFIFIISVLFL